MSEAFASFSSPLNSGKWSLIALTSSLVAKVSSLDLAIYFSSALVSLINPSTLGNSDFLAKELKSCSGTVTELSEPEIVIVLPTIESNCLSLSGLVSRVVTLAEISPISFLVANVDSLSACK